ncbi:MAG: autotransporter-associated beta strand repeat-containing protein, partial [Kiritimatiellae bacterium]|nr:autotransporter-associated beta strand repeat-containing protein [Kiritimatiellia bacterium]
DIDVVLDMQDPNRSFTYGDLYDVDVAKSLTVLSDSNFRIYADSVWRHVTNSIPSAITLKNGLFFFSLGHPRTPKMVFHASALEREKGMFLLKGHDLGLTPLTNTTAYGFSLALGSAPALRGTSLGTGTQTPILHAAVVDPVEGGYGLGFGTYDDEFGVRALDFATEYTNAITDGQSALDNVRIHNDGVGLITNLVTAPLTTINSLTMTEDAGAGQCGIIVTSAPNATLRINSGMIFAYQAMTNTPTTADSLVLAVPNLDFNGQDGLIYVRETKYGSNGSLNAPLRYRSNPTNLSTNGLFFYGPSSGAYIYLENADVNTYTGPVTLGGKAFVRLANATKDKTILGQLIVDGASCQISDHELADDTADIILRSGSVLIKTGATNSGNGGSETFRDLMIFGGKYTHSGDAGGNSSMRNASVFGGEMNQTRSTETTVRSDMMLAGGVLTLNSNTASDRSGARVIIKGNLTISNTVSTTAYNAINLGYSYYRNPDYLSLTNKLSVIGNAVNPNAVAITRAYSTDPKTMLAEIRLNDEVECLVTDGAADIDFDVDANFADSGVIVGTLVKTGAGTLRMTAVTNALTGGIQVNAGRLVLDGGASSDVAVATGATLAGDGLIDADLTFADGATYEVKILDETTAAVLDVAGTVTASGEVTVPVAQNQADGEWLVMTADSFDADFVASNPRFALYTRNGGTELWLTKKLGTLIVVR